MKSKDRIMKTINHRNTDYLPTFLIGLKDAEEKYIKHFKARDYWEVCRKIGVDILIAGPRYTGRNIKIEHETTLSTKIVT